MRQNLSVLGSTGSIGTQTLQVARSLKLSVRALAANRNIKELENQIREFRPQLAAVFDSRSAKELRIAAADLDVKIVQGMEGLCEAAACEQADVVCNSVVGMVGLKPTLAAISAKKDVALSNKETLVAGGSLVMEAARKQGVHILPVDSEHSAVFQCLQGCPSDKAIRRILLTASGGPFFGMKREELRHVTPQQALRHPNWSMGPKVTIDSSTMMNKGLEVIEAAWLFRQPPERIEVVVHRESVVHSMVEFADSSVIAQLGVPDMRLPIQYALTWPERVKSPAAALDLLQYGTLSFFAPDEETFLCLQACRRAAQKGGLSPAAANGANEAAVPLFLEGKLSFLQIGELVSAAVERQKEAEAGSLEDILQADLAAREFVRESAEKMR